MIIENVQWPDFYLIKLLLQSKHGENALFEAVSYKRKDIVELLIHHGMNYSFIYSLFILPFNPFINSSVL